MRESEQGQTNNPLSSHHRSDQASPSIEGWDTHGTFARAGNLGGRRRSLSEGRRERVRALDQYGPRL